MILIVDDDAGFSESVAELLVSEDFEVAQATTLDAALAQVAARDVALVICDHSLVRELPSPWAALERLRQAAHPAAVGVCTGWKLAEPEVLARGLSFLITKPFEAEDLLTVASQFGRPVPALPQTEATVKAYFRAVESCDWRALGALCTEDVCYLLPAAADSPPAAVQGRAEFLSFFERTFSGVFPESRFVVNRLFAIPSGATVARYESSWRSVSGGRATLPGALVFRMEQDRIAEIGVRLEILALLSRQAG